MIPIPGYDAVRVAWIRIEAEGFTLYGFLLYTFGDLPFYEYFNASGLADLDSWTGKECAVFVLHAPSQAWIDYTAERNHSWSRIFGDKLEPAGVAMDTLQRYGSVPFAFNGEARTLQSILDPPLNEFAHQDEVQRILQRFECNPTDHPCLILFRSLRKNSFWFVSLHDMLDLPLHQMRQGFREWFGGKFFKDILRQARNA